MWWMRRVSFYPRGNTSLSRQVVTIDPDELWSVAAEYSGGSCLTLRTPITDSRLSVATCQGSPCTIRQEKEGGK